MKRKIVDKIDADHDGLVEVEEMRAWLKATKLNVIRKDVESRWKLFESYNTLKEYLQVNYGALDNCKR